MNQREKAAREVEVASAEPASAREFEDLIAAPIGDKSESSSTPQIDGVVIGRLIGFADNGTGPLVTHPGQADPVPLRARATVDLQAIHIGRDVVLAFEGGDPRHPVVLGCLWQPSAAPLTKVVGVEVEADGERLVVAANQGLVLRCGKASITLSPDGKIVVRGTQVVSHASGLNRIRGGSVQLN